MHKQPGDLTQMRTFLEHPLTWWSALSPLAQVALFVMLLGLSMLGAAIWTGGRRWLRRIRLAEGKPAQGGPPAAL